MSLHRHWAAFKTKSFVQPLSEDPKRFMSSTISYVLILCQPLVHPRAVSLWLKWQINIYSLTTERALKFQYFIPKLHPNSTTEIVKFQLRDGDPIPLFPKSIYFLCLFYYCRSGTFFTPSTLSLPSVFQIWNPILFRTHYFSKTCRSIFSMFTKVLSKYAF